MPEKVKVEVFTSKMCPYCPAAVELARDVGGELAGMVRIEEVDASEEPGRAKAIAYGIRSVPTIILNSKQSFVGVPDREELVSAIKELSGSR